MYEFFSLKFILVFIYLLFIIIYSPSHSLYIFLILITFILILSFINFIIKRSYLANKIYKYGKAPFSYLLLIPFLNVITGSSNSKIYLPILQQFENDISSNIFFHTVTSFLLFILLYLTSLSLFKNKTYASPFMKTSDLE